VAFFGTPSDIVISASSRDYECIIDRIAASQRRQDTKSIRRSVYVADVDVALTVAARTE